MAYFENAQEGDRVECTIYGKGEIIMVCKDCKYSLMVLFDNGKDIPYSIEGVPAMDEHSEQTLFYESEAK